MLRCWNAGMLGSGVTGQVERLLRMPPGAFFGIPGEPGQEMAAPGNGLGQW